MKNAEYWRKRFLILEKALLNGSLKSVSEIEDVFRSSQRELESNIARWYARFAKNNKIDIATAREWLQKKDLEEFKWSVDEYIKKAQNMGLNPQWMKQLENASARFHISKYEALQLEIHHTIESLYGNILDKLDFDVKRAYLDTYYHSCFELQKGYNIGWDIAKINQKQLEAIISKPWTTDDRTFSDRIWANKTALLGEVNAQLKRKMLLLDEVNAQLTRNIILGKAPDDAIAAIARKFQTSKHNAGRLVMTESAYFSSVAHKDAYQELDVERFEILATLDRHTSKICQSLDGKVFDMKDYEAGVTAPPFHPWCRSTTVPYFEDDFGERAARGADGKTYYVPSDMKYPDWKKIFVDGKGDKTLLDEWEKSKMHVEEKPAAINMGTLAASIDKQTHVDALKSILEAAPQSIKEAWNKYAGRVAVQEAYDPQGGAFCMYTKGITVNFDKIAKGETYLGEIAKKPYYTALHEFGHNVSALMANDINGLAYSDIANVYRSKTLADSNSIGYTLTEMLEKEGAKRVNAIWARMKAEAKAAGQPVKSVRKYCAYQEIKNEMLSKPVLSTSDVSDIWDGLSNGQARAHYGHSQKKNYWKQISVGTEAFAEMFSAAAMNPDSAEQIKYYFPDSYKLFEEILQEMGKT